MGLLLAFMFLWNMLGALVLVPALAHLLLRRQPAPAASTAAVPPLEPAALQVQPSP